MTTNHDEAARSAAYLAMYPDALICRICGLALTLGNADDARWAGDSTNPRAFLAHGECWEQQPPRAEWAWPDDWPPTAAQVAIVE